MIQSIQKVIKIGSSAGVTIPAKLLKQGGIKVGDEVRVTIIKIDQCEPDMTDSEIIDTARKILKRYNQDFRNLADR